MATRQYLPKARQVWERRRWPRPKEGTPRRCPFLNTAGDGTQWDPRREKHSPLFVPLGFLVPVSRNPSWEAFSLVSGCLGDRYSTVRFGSPSNFHRDIPSLMHAAGFHNSTRSAAGSPLSPLSKARSPQSTGFSPFAAPPPRRGHNGKLSFSRCLDMAGTRLVPPHSLAFRPEWLSKGTPPDASPAHCLDVVGKGRRCAAWVPAERSAPARGPTQKGRTAPGGLPHHLSVRSHAAPKGISSGRIGTRTAARVRPQCGRTCLSHLLHTPGLQGFAPRDKTSFRHNVGPSPRSRSVGIKVARPQHWKFTPKEAVTPLMNRRYSTRYPGAKRFSQVRTKVSPASVTTLEKQHLAVTLVAHGVMRAGLHVLHKAGIVPDSHLTELDPANITPERPSIPSSISPFPPPPSFR